MTFRRFSFGLRNSRRHSPDLAPWRPSSGPRAVEDRSRVKNRVGEIEKLAGPSGGEGRESVAIYGSGCGAAAPRSEDVDARGVVWP